MNRIKTIYEKIKSLIRSIFPGLMKKLSRFRYRIKLKRKEPEVIFSDYYQNNKWGDKESISGPGSRLDRTQKIRDELPKFAWQFNISTVLDLPCGDFNWMRYVEWEVDYTGADIVQELINSNEIKYGTGKRQFKILNILEDALPKVDLILCRDCLVHFSYDDIVRALCNIQKSGSTYLLTTTMIDRKKNHNIVTGEFRSINLQKPPFNFPDPIVLLDDTYPLPSYYDKHLGLWKISELEI
jgi:SAM-dependent methyltransferase